jgi:adenylate kinase
VIIMRIVITGSPGTGKTTIGHMLSELLGLELVDIKKLVEEKGLCQGPECEVDVLELARELEFLEEKDDYIVEGHLACEMELPAEFVIVLRTNPEVLRSRLAERGYGEKKLGENLMAEMLDYCTQRAEKLYPRKPMELDTSSRTPEECVALIQEAVKNNKKKLDSVDYSASLSRLLGKGDTEIDLRNFHEGREETD